uniref:ribosomal protein L29 n=1 Tax=Nemalion vermiculare TaxID=935621 RepID=UPI00257DA748|nr:ribosomal protein L29 [Nemalion vermiculare]WGV34470.1 ribosomal protein L29 [Nemalion vermiculare]
MNELNSKDLRLLSNKELNSKILEIKKTLFDFRMKQGTRQSIRPHILKSYKNQLSRIMTIRHEKRLK